MLPEALAFACWLRWGQGTLDLAQEVFSGETGYGVWDLWKARGRSQVSGGHRPRCGSFLRIF